MIGDYKRTLPLASLLHHANKKRRKRRKNRKKRRKPYKRNKGRRSRNNAPHAEWNGISWGTNIREDG